jgi:aryl-alcohol dehydrogenase-like predicted oxidoreductase
MELRRFATTDLRVSKLGLGCARIGGIFQRDSSGFVDLLSAARDGGINFFDTADIYCQGESETLLGRAFRRQRDRIVIASKAGYVLPAQRRVVARLKPWVRPLISLLRIRRDLVPAAVRGSPAQDFSSAHLQRAVEGSLRRLGTDYLDLLQLHSPPADVVERGEWQEALDALKRAGKIRYYGVSCDTVEAALAALRFPGVSVLQLPISLLDRRFVEPLLPRARERGVATIARECLANGVLARAPEDSDLEASGRSSGEEALRARQLAEYRQRAAANGSTLARLALEYVIGLEGVSVTLIGVSKREQLDSLLADVLAR